MNEVLNFSTDFCNLSIKQTDKTMMIYDAGYGVIKYSYGETMSLCRKCIAFFDKQGLKRGDTVVAVLPNSPEAVIIFFTAAMAGINYAPVPCAISSREFENWLELVKPSLIIRKSGVAEYDTDISTVICKCNGDLSWLPNKEQEIIAEISGLLYLKTSGTTGIPKALAVSVDKLWNSGMAFVRHYHLENSECRFWNYLPMSYLGGLFNLALIPICCRGSFVIAEPFSGKTMLNFWYFVQKHDITALWFVPTIVQGILKIANLSQGDFYKDICKNIKVSFLGTAPISLVQKENFEKKFGLTLYENFALSETTFLTGEANDVLSQRENGSVGQVLPYVNLKLVPLADDAEIGEIWVKTPFLFKGYLQADGAYELEQDKEGFFNTKDLGILRDNKILVLKGRARDIIKKGGLFVSLTEIENAVKELSYVEDVAAVPSEHDFYGEVYNLCVIFSGGVEKKSQTNILRLWMLDNFVAYKMPEKILPFDVFPRTLSGKIKKKDLESIVKNER